MFRTDFDISEDDFANVVNPHNKLISDHIYKEILFQFVAFYIASGYRMNALWEGSLIGHVNSAIESLSCVIFKDNFDSTELKKILSEKYNLTIINENPLTFKETKKGTSEC